MGFLLFIGSIVLGLISWILWAIIAVTVVFAAAVIPWFIWDFLMRCTFYNIINWIAKLPSIFGIFFGFILTLPAAIVSICITLWAYANTLLIALLTFRGDPDTTFCQEFGTRCIEAFESEGCHHMIIARFYYEHCKWIWGGAGFMHSYFPWQSGCGEGPLFGVGETLPVPMIIVKLFLLAFPYLLMFVLPLFPVIWSFSRPVLGAMAKFPAISENGDGRD